VTYSKSGNHVDKFGGGGDSVSTPQLSVCIVFHNEEVRARKCLEALALQPLEFICEVILIDNASTDETYSILKGSSAKLPFPTRVHKRETNNLGAARAEAMIAATARYVAFIDADIIVPSDWALRFSESIRLHLQSDRQIAGLAGANSPDVSSPWGAASSLIFRYVNLGSPQVAQASGVESVLHVSTCNVVFDREAVIRVGNFNASFKVVCEDVELCCRLRRLGYELLFLKGHEVIHAQASSPLEWLRRSARYGYGNMRVVSLYREFFSRRHWTSLVAGAVLLGLCALVLILPVAASALIFALLCCVAGLSFLITLRHRSSGSTARVFLLLIAIPTGYALGHIAGLFAFHVPVFKSHQRVHP